MKGTGSSIGHESARTTIDLGAALALEFNDDFSATAAAPNQYKHVIDDVKNGTGLSSNESEILAD